MPVVKSRGPGALGPALLLGETLTSEKRVANTSNNNPRSLTTWTSRLDTVKGVICETLRRGLINAALFNVIVFNYGIGDSLSHYLIPSLGRGYFNIPPNLL